MEVKEAINLVKSNYEPFLDIDKCDQALKTLIDLATRYEQLKGWPEVRKFDPKGADGFYAKEFNNALDLSKLACLKGMMTKIEMDKISQEDKYWDNGKFMVPEFIEAIHTAANKKMFGEK